MLNNPECACPSRVLCADKMMPIWRDAIYHDPSFTAQSEPGGIRFEFPGDKTVFVSECRCCAFEYACSAAEKIAFHHPTAEGHLTYRTAYGVATLN